MNVCAKVSVSSYCRGVGTDYTNSKGCVDNTFALPYTAMRWFSVYLLILEKAIFAKNQLVKNDNYKIISKINIAMFSIICPLVCLQMCETSSYIFLLPITATSVDSILPAKLKVSNKQYGTLAQEWHIKCLGTS